MLGASTSNTTNTNTTMNNTTLELTCSTCLAHFGSKETKREHMKEDWHVYNLKRRIASLTPISREIFETQIRISPSSSECSEEVSSESSSLRSLSPSAEEDEEDEKSETVGLGEGIVRIDDELRLPSGKIISHRSHPRAYRPRPTERHISPDQQLLNGTETSPGSEDTRMEYISSQERKLALSIRKNTETSLMGVSEVARRALMATEKEMEAAQSRKMNEFQSGVERRGNKQKRFRVLTMGKKAGGLEKRNG